MSRRLEITLGDELLVALDGARGHESRASFVRRAVAAAVGVKAPPPSRLFASGEISDRQAKLNAAKAKR